MPQIQRFKQGAITLSASGDNTAVAAATAQIITVWKMWFTAAGAVNVTFKDGASTSLSGIGILTGNGSSLVFDYDGSPWYQTSPGNAFIINLSGATAISGTVYYTVGG